MSKRNRFLIILAVLGLCLYCLWPSINWYFRTTKDAQQIALSSLEKIREYSIKNAVDSVKKLESDVKANPSAPVAAEYDWLCKESVKNYKKFNAAVPAEMNMSAMMKGFSLGYNMDTAEQRKEAANAIHDKLVSKFQERIRSKILKDKKNYTNAVKLGLDLAGGVNVIIRADLDAAVAAKGKDLKPETVPLFKQQAMANAIEVLTSRIDRFGLTEPVIRQQGEDRIYIEIPGEGQETSMDAIVMGSGLLNFRLVDDEATESFTQYYYSNLATTFDENGKLLNPSILPDDCEVLGIYGKDEYGLDQFKGYLVIKKQVALDGKHVTNVTTSTDQMGQIGVDLTLDTEGSQIFGDLTSKNVGKRLAIVSDNKIKSAPVIKTAIIGSRVRVDGFGVDEARNLQKVLETATLDVPLEIESQQVIGASLGAISIEQGKNALLIGLALIMVFMLIYYKGAGINAIVAQVLNLYFLFSILSALNLTLTLPSIAGMVLTIGMAVDANVIIFERIKEELRNGKSRRASIEAGFDGAFWAIMDSNITTFIAALFLSVLGTGSIQGFAVSLAIGVVSSVFTALFVSRLMFDFNSDVFNKESVSISWRIK
ncbi:MAG: protein translocase subunit SecD [Treponema sp.]|uniref:protein translocase subunit SecD n=1 Tax=Treponema sp. TaxID=166 RepID=UPI00298D955F|nr:protein translocase subunit SecD [Treponema sp.]MBR5933155.1 protein translocase subunit SecD [Treponema sp.]